MTLSALFKKYKEPILYIVFGGVTTLVSLVSFALCNRLLGEGLYLISNIISWVLAVAVAFVTNKLWVFESKSWAPGVLWRELPAFAGARIFSLLVEEAGLFLLVDILGFDGWSYTLCGFAISGEMIAKFLMQVVVLILNYIFSKLVIFKKKA